MQLKSIVHVAMKIECEIDKEERKNAAKFVAEYISDSLGGYRRKPRHFLGQMAHKVSSWVPCVCFGAPYKLYSPLAVAVAVPNPNLHPKTQTQISIRRCCFVRSLALSVWT